MEFLKLGHTHTMEKLMDNKDKNDGVKRMRGRRRYFFSSYVFFKKHKKVRGHKSTGVSFLHLVQKK